MSLYQGKYRRTKCSTAQPKHPGWYRCWFNGSEVSRDYYWDGSMWRYQKGSYLYNKAAFGNYNGVKKSCLWAKIDQPLL